METVSAAKVHQSISRASQSEVDLNRELDGILGDEVFDSFASVELSEKIVQAFQINDKQTLEIKRLISQLSSRVFNCRSTERLQKLELTTLPEIDAFQMAPLTDAEVDQIKAGFAEGLNTVLGKPKAEHLMQLVSQTADKNVLLAGFGRMRLQVEFDQPEEGMAFFANISILDPVNESRQVSGVCMQWKQIPEPWDKIFAEVSEIMKP